MRILIVDDSPEILGYLADFLTDKGHKVVTAEDGEKGYKVFRYFSYFEGDIDLVITDLNMPNRNGYWLARQIHIVSHDTPILLHTGESFVDKKEGITAIIQKGDFKSIERHLVGDWRMDRSCDD